MTFDKINNIRDLTYRQAECLYTIRNLQCSTQYRKENINNVLLAEHLKIKAGGIRKLINEINKYSTNTIYKYLIIHRYPNSSLTKKGRSSNYYEIFIKRIVTHKETAIMLLALLNFQHEKPFRIDKKAFENYCFTLSYLQQQNISLSAINTKLQLAAEVGYLEIEEPFYIYYTPRISQEKLYLEFIASDSSN